MYIYQLMIHVQQCVCQPWCFQAFSMIHDHRSEECQGGGCLRGGGEVLKIEASIYTCTVYCMCIPYSGKFSQIDWLPRKLTSLCVWAPWKLKPRKFLLEPSEAIPHNFALMKISRYTVYMYVSHMLLITGYMCLNGTHVTIHAMTWVGYMEASPSALWAS